MSFPLVLAIFLPLLCSPIFFLLEKNYRHLLGWIGSFIPISSALLIFHGAFQSGEQTMQVLKIAPYFSPLNMHVSFLVDGLSLFFAFLVTIMGALVFIYANDYMLEEKRGNLALFYASLCAFITSMLGTVFSNDLILQFTFWELTGVCSFILIGYHFWFSKTAQSAKSALLITTFADLGLFAGLLLLGFSLETFSWNEILIKGVSQVPLYLQQTIFLLLLLGILGKSAQIPFHFWLPGAMCAPTPVSSYLHAATMVKLGIFLIARIYPLFVLLQIWFPVVTTLCFSTMILGGIFSLLSHDLKAILAWATVSQLGFFIGFYGLGDSDGVTYDFVHILNHALYKGALFMLVGIIYHATKERDVRKLGGLFTKLPLTAIAFFIACASMAGIPGTTGFLSKELVVADLIVLKKGVFFPLIFIAVILGSLFKVALSLRLFFHLFIRQGKSLITNILHKPSLSLQISPLILASLAFLFGIWPRGLEQIIPHFYVSGLHADPSHFKGIFHGGILELTISGGIIVSGTILFLLAERVNWAWRGIPHLLNFQRYFTRFQAYVVKGAKLLTKTVEPATTESAQLLVFLSFSLLLLAHLPFDKQYYTLVHDLDPIRFFVSSMLIFSCFGVIFLQNRISKLISLSIAGFLISLLFVLFHAPDLAMTQVLIEVITLFLLLFLLNETPQKQAASSPPKFAFLVSTIFGASMFALCCMLYSVDLPHIGSYFPKNTLTLTASANSVNSIVVNFRGFDTLGESLVLVIACLGIIGLLRIRCRYPEMAMQLSTTDFFPSLSLSRKMGHASRSLVLASFTKPLFFVVNLVAIYLLLRGHNDPGGGFVGGVCTSISLILIGISMEWGKVLSIIRVEPLQVASWGLVVMTAVFTAPFLFGYPLLYHPHKHLEIAGIVDFSSQLFFDVGIYLLVSGVFAEILFAFKKRLSMKYAVSISSLKEKEQ